MDFPPDLLIEGDSQATSNAEFSSEAVCFRERFDIVQDNLPLFLVFSCSILCSTFLM